MKQNKLYSDFLAKKTDADFPIRKLKPSKEIGEISLYKFIDHETKDAQLLSSSELSSEIEALKKEGIETIILHYGHFFNADYSDLLTLVHYAHQWFEGELFTMSPEEIVFLSIRGDKRIEEVLTDLKNEGVKNTLGFLPNSIVQSKYYADMDELLIEDRHSFFDLCKDHKISFNYPFNLGQVEFEEEFLDMIDYIKENSITDIVLQPNELIDTDESFDYELGQKILLQITDEFKVPMHMPIENYYTESVFPVLKRNKSNN